MLLALFDAGHVHHTRAKSWLVSQTNPRWATCPLTENGFVRIISQPSYPGAISVSRAIALLKHASSTEFHEFWADDLSILDEQLFDRRRVVGPKQVTDIYLLALAVKKGGCLVALDRAISLTAVLSAEPHHLIVL